MAHYWRGKSNSSLTRTFTLPVGSRNILSGKRLLYPGDAVKAGFRPRIRADSDRRYCLDSAIIVHDTTVFLNKVGD